MKIWLILSLAFAALVSMPDGVNGESLFEEKAELYGHWRATLIVLLWGAVGAAPVAFAVWVIRQCVARLVHR